MKLRLWQPLYAGDNYFNENLDEVTAGVAKALENYKPDIVIAGPAFNADATEWPAVTFLKSAV